MTIGSPRPFWPIGSARPPAEVWYRWKETLVDYVNLLPFVNKVSVPEAIKVKLLRLCLGEHGQTTFDTRRLDEATTLDDALIRLDSIWGTEDNTLTTYPQPIQETAEEFLYRHQLKDLLQKYASECTNNSSIAVGSLKEKDFLTAAGEEVEVVVAHPRALMYAEVRKEVVLATEETTLLKEPIFEYLSLTEHQCGEPFTACSDSVSCSYENTILLDPSMEDVVPKPLTGEVAVVITSDSHLKTKTTLNPPPSYTLIEAQMCLIHQRKVLPSWSTSRPHHGMRGRDKRASPT